MREHHARDVDQPGVVPRGQPASPLLPPLELRTLMDALYARGPFGFRGPAADRVPDHLTQWDAGVRTTQVIAPGAACPANAFFDLADAIITVRRLVRRAWTTHRWDTRPARRP